MAELSLKTIVSSQDGSLGYLEHGGSALPRRVFFIEGTEPDSPLSHCTEDAFMREGERARRYTHSVYTFSDMVVG